MKFVSRRNFLTAASIVAGSLATGSREALGARPAGSRPIVVSSGNGLRATEQAMKILKAGGRPLDAVIAGVNIVEDDPKDMTVGFGGLPNERGIVELDASVMDGPSGGAGAVASIQGIKNPSRVARLVMERTDHVLLVGEGAQQFAVAHGFKVEDLLTEESRKVWLEWLETRSTTDDWGPSEFEADNPHTMSAASRPQATGLSAESLWMVKHPPTGTINCLAVDAKGDIAGTTTTSGLAFKIPGRVGDSPLIGCGLYVDNEVGGAGSTGRGEEVIKINGARIVVENMRRGMTPTDACLDALQRIVDRYKSKGKPAWNVNFYAVNKDGVSGGAAIWDKIAGPDGGHRIQHAVFDETGNSLRDSAFLFKRDT